MVFTFSKGLVGQKDKMTEKKEFTPEHIDLYNEVITSEIAIHGGLLKRSLASVRSKMDDKSALLNRIYEGKTPLRFRPPTSCSYPWYSIIEESNPQSVMYDYLNIDDGIQANRNLVEDFIGSKPSRDGLVINQTRWNLVEKVSNHRARITYKGWESLGFEWELRLDRLSIDETESAIISLHDRSLKKIRTIDQLEAEEEFRFGPKIDLMKISQSTELTKEAMAQALLKDGGEGRSLFHQTSLKHSLKHWSDEVAKRLAAGKSPYPSDHEIKCYAKDTVIKSYLTARAGWGWYSVREDGELISHEWRIHRVLPFEVDERIYWQREKQQACI